MKNPPHKTTRLKLKIITQAHRKISNLTGDKQNSNIFKTISIYLFAVLLLTIYFLSMYSE